MNVTIKQNVIRSTDGRIKYKKFHPNGKEHYHSRVWIDGDDRTLDDISSVEYHLHSTFRNPIRRSENRRNGFSVTFWTWGMFEIKVVIHTYSKGTETITHHLSFDLPPDDGNTYVDVS